MYTLGIPKRDYRRASQVLGYESAEEIPYNATLQDDGFYIFTFTEVGDEYSFRKIVNKLKMEGVRVIGADAQLTEKKIMKLASLINLEPLKEIDLNDPALMRARAAKGQGNQMKSNPRISFDQVLDLRNEKRDLELQISNLYREMESDPDVESEGGPVADQYGDTLNRLETRLYKVIKQISLYDMSEGEDEDEDDEQDRADVNADIKSMFEGQKIGNTSYKTRTAVNTAPGKTEDKEIFIDNTDDLNNITIRWRGANHHGNKTLANLKFTRESEFDEDLMAFSNDSKWLFIVDLDEETGEPDWDTLMVDNRELENVADDGTSTYSVPDEDMINETTEKSWNSLDVSRKAEKEIDNKEWNARTTKKLDMLIALNAAGKFKKDFSDERLQGWVDQNYSWEKLSRQFKLSESYSAMFKQIIVETLQVTSENGNVVFIEDPRDIEDFLSGKGTVYGEDQDGGSVEVSIDNALDYQKVANEGSCGYGPKGVPGNTPGGTQGMDADDRTRSMMKKLIQKEIAKLSEADSLDDKLRGALGDKDFEKVINKPVPSLADLKPEPKEKKSKFKKAGEKSGFDMRGLK